MLKLKVPQEMLQELCSIAYDLGFKSSEEFVCYVLEELLEVIRDEDFLVGSKKISNQEQSELRAKLQDLGYM
jgi:hypothetical protein